ncbi:MAG: hypothetical protein WA632_15435, partial [Gallionella sp.]
MIIDIKEGGEISVALKDDGTVWTGGNGDRGQLGNRTWTIAQKTPVQVVGPGRLGFLDHIVSIASGGGGQHVLALKDDGTVWACGMNGNGQLGNGKWGDNERENAPIQVHG